MRSRLLLTDELQDFAVEGLGLLPVHRVSGLRHEHEFHARHMGGLAAHNPGRRLQVLICGDKQGRDPTSRAARRDRRALSWDGAPFCCECGGYPPAFKTFGMDRHVSHAHFAELGRRLGNPGSAVSRAACPLRVVDGAATGSNDQAEEPLRSPERVVVGDEAAASNANEVEGIEFEVSRERIEVFGYGAGLGPVLDPQCSTPASAIEVIIRYPASPSLDVVLPASPLPVFACNSTTGAPLPLSVYHRGTPGRFAYPAKLRLREFESLLP